MKNIFRLTCLAIGLCFTTLPAQATDFKPYAGVGLGGIIIDAGLGSQQAFGGYGILGADLHENYGIEFRFGTIGETTSTVIVPRGVLECGECTSFIIVPTPTPATVSVDWFVSYLLKLQYPLDDDLRIYGMVGGTTFKSKFAFAVLGTQRTTVSGFSYGGGIDYNLGNQWLLGVDAMVYANKASTDPGVDYTGLDLWGLTATIKYEF